MTTNAPSTRSRSSNSPDATCSSVAVGKGGQGKLKVEGLVVRLDRGSSNLPVRIGKPGKCGVSAVWTRAVLRGGNVGTRAVGTRVRTPGPGAAGERPPKRERAAGRGLATRSSRSRAALREEAALRREPPARVAVAVGSRSASLSRTGFAEAAVRRRREVGGLLGARAQAARAPLRLKPDDGDHHVRGERLAPRAPRGQAADRRELRSGACRRRRQVVQDSKMIVPWAQDHPARC